MSLKERFGALVAAHRRKRGITQQQLAEASGLSPDMVSRIETGSTAVRFSTVERLASALKVDPAELFGLDGSNFERPAMVRLTATLAKLSDDQLEIAADILEAAFRVSQKRTRVARR